ncbi:homocysteine S-methyltransferase [Lentilactobacillus sp. Marseille-Q4993]|uniref:homocysteine S-methyltransferase n=1 Tax=Lentilactobacillus sp. Marseille-Q4993 TaxID=3039492 RepID=UPI0024BCF54E|nr:homocysteine S-methyltransferase [Lentilactobacillus sp. Marseille-Q4993]
MVGSLLKQRLLRAPHNALVLDGAMGTLLENEGLIDSDKLWSSQTLINNPEAIYDAHTKYLEAGADIIITTTYQSNPLVFTTNGMSDEDASHYIHKAVKLAKQARNDFAARTQTLPAVIAGSVAPYGAFLSDGSEYTGDYHLTKYQYQDFHRPLLEELDDAGIDIFALETMPRFDEIQALVELLYRDFSNKRAWVSLSTADERTICDGTPISEVVRYLDEQPNIELVGVNCTSIHRISELINEIKKYTDKPVIVYPNNGDVFDTDKGEWVASKTPADFGEFAQKWLAEGANVIGGCCRTTPADVRKIAERVYDLKVDVS